MGIGEDLYELVEFQAGRVPDGEALREGERSWTWRELDSRVARLAAALAANGLEPGERFATLDKNGAATMEATLAAARDGFAHVVVNNRLAADEIAYVLEDSAARILLVGAEFADLVERVRDRLPALREVVVLGEAYERYIGEAPEPQERRRPAPDDCVLQLYTSGTTGFPKGAMLSHRGLGAHTRAAAEAFGMDAASVNMVAMPLFHVGGSCWALLSMYAGGRTLIVRDVVPGAILDMIEARRVTHAFFVPTVFEYLLAEPRVAAADLSSLRCLGYGGSPMPQALLRRCLETFAAGLYQVYGMTEASGVFNVLGPDEHRAPDRPELLTSAGRPIGDVQVRVVDPGSERDLPAGETGEFWIRTEQLMSGYWNRPAETAQSIRDGWFRTGDAGFRDETGYLYIRDRVHDMIITGGENVYPAEVERVVATHPAVADACVVGVPDETYGESVKAVVVAAAGEDVDADGLIAFCRERLAGYKCPRSVTVVDALPRNAAGKVLRRSLRDA